MAVGRLEELRDYLMIHARHASVDVFGERWIRGRPSEFGLCRDGSALIAECRMAWEWADITFSNGYDFLIFGNQDLDHPEDIVDEILHIYIQCASGKYITYKGMCGHRMKVLQGGEYPEFIGRKGKRPRWFHEDGPYLRWRGNN